MSSIIRLVDPAQQLVAAVPKVELENFLASRNLVALPGLIAGTRTVTDPVTAALVDRGSRPHDVLVVRSADRLTERLRTALAEGRTVIFEPTPGALRGYFNTAGFIRAMKELASCLPEGSVLVRPGLYGRQHLFALKPNPGAGAS